MMIDYAGSSMDYLTQEDCFTEFEEKAPEDYYLKVPSIGVVKANNRRRARKYFLYKRIKKLARDGKEL